MTKPDWWPRFEVKYVANETTGCWLWTASLYWDGYGEFRLDGRVQRAHRVAYEALVGPIPEGLLLDHSKAKGCPPNRHCVNPAHLEPVTHIENARRGAKTLIDDETGLQIQSLYATGEWLQRELAEAFGISQTTVSRLIRR